MKPLMDMLGDYGSEAINMLSSCAVFAMSLVNCARRLVRSGGKDGRRDEHPADAPPRARLILLALGSAVGGYFGQLIFDALAGSSDSVKRIQNAVMAALVLLIFFYMLFKDRLPSLHFKSVPAYIIVGVLLGVISSFLGIGGGPVNVALLTLLFAMDIKNAVFASLLSVLFTQSAKLATVFFTKGTAPFTHPMMPFMIIGAVVGAALGSLVAKKLSSKSTKILFTAVQVIILAVCILNIIRA